MADNFFDGTFDDFLDDQTLLDLADLHWPLNSPSPPRSNFASPVRSGLLESPAVSRSRSRHGTDIGDSPSLFDGSLQERPALPPASLGAVLEPGSTRAGSYNRPMRTTATSRRPELSRLINASRRTFENPNSPPFHPNSTTHRASTQPGISTTWSSSRSALASTIPLHGLPDLSANPNDRQASRSDCNPSAGHSHDPHISTRSPHYNHTNHIPDLNHFGFTAGSSRQPAIESATPDYGIDSDSSFLAMSSGTRRRSVRPTDLTLPSAPTQAGSQPSRSAARTSRRSSSRSLQPRSSPTNKRKREPEDDDDLFGDGFFAEHEVVDLVDKDEIPAEILASQEKHKNYVRLSAFDCVICMDNVKDLTVTHCGHLFCSECLHSALNMDQSKRTCPVCRQKIDKVPASGKFGQKAKGFYPLELKLTTKSGLGRRHNQVR